VKIKILVTLFFVVNIIACSAETDCFIADSLTPLKTVKIEGTDYFIYLRISGFQEKIAYYELYKDKPVFDVCGQSSIEAIYGDSVDPALGTVSKLMVMNDKLIIIYSKDRSSIIELKNVPVEIN